jgi:DNA-binding transcriptional MerR regulator
MSSSSLRRASEGEQEQAMTNSSAEQPTEQAADTEREQYTIDELAAHTRIPSRTIRFYQSNGALARPEIKGRVAYYGPEHVERLHLIGKLQDRGLRIKAIRALVEKIDKGELALGEWLGLEAQLQSSWLNEQAQVMTEQELSDVVADGRPGLVAELVRHKIVEKQGNAYLVSSPALLHAMIRLEKAGIDVGTAQASHELVRKHVGKLSDDLGSFFMKHAGQGFGRSVAADDLAQAFEAFRPMSMELIQVVFAQEMERVLSQILQSGQVTKVALKRKTKSKER